jgi:hypothetical protein
MSARVIAPVALWVVALGAPALAQTNNPTSRDITAPLTGTGDQLRDIIDRDKREQEDRRETAVTEQSTAEGNVTVTVQKSGAVRGNLETKLEVAEEFFDANQTTRLSRVKTVFGQGHLNFAPLPEWWVFVHIAREWHFDDGFGGTAQDDSNLIAEINPRWQREFGPGLYGVEVGFSTEARYELTRTRLRPFVDYWVSDRCRVFGSVAGGYTFLELGGNEPDFAFASAEPGFSCFAGNASIFGLYTKAQIGWNFNDDHGPDSGAEFVDGRPVGAWAVTKTSNEFRVSPFFHHRFRNHIGMTTWAELGRVQDESEIDGFFWEDAWVKGVVFLEYPIRPNLVVYGEASVQYGNRILSVPNADPEAFGYADDFRYVSVGGLTGLNYFF